MRLCRRENGKGHIAYQNSRNGFLIVPRRPREEVRKNGSFQSGAKYGIYRYEQPPLAKQGIVLKSKRLAFANAVLAGGLGLYPCGLSHINREKIDAIREAVKELEKAGYIVRSRERDEKGRLRGADYVIYEQPQPREPEAATSVGQPPILDLPALENPTLENPTLKNLRRKNLRWKIQRN